MRTLCLIQCFILFNLCWFPTAETNNGCTELPIDMVFVLDSSGSVGAGNFQKMLDFFKAMVTGFEIGQSTTRIGAVRFSTSVDSPFHLNTYYDKNGMLNAISNIVYDDGGTNTADAIRYVSETSFKWWNGARSNAPKIAVIITDGQSNDKKATKKEASKLRNKGVTVISVGVGDGVDQTELNDIATDPDYQHVFMVSNFNALRNIRGELAKRTCSVSCGNPGTISNGAVSGNDYSSGKTVTYTCNREYNLTGNAVRTCQKNGVWSGSKPQCIFANSCGSNPCRNNATCINGLNTYKCKCVKGWAGSNCQTDVQPPETSFCPGNKKIISEENIKDIKWTMPIFHDPFRKKLSISTNYPKHESSFLWGDYSVSYVALKESNGLRAFCNFNITYRPHPCPQLKPPRNGALVCNGWKSDIVRYCIIFCQTGYNLPKKFSIKQEYMCGGSGKWSTLGLDLLPDCQVSYSKVQDTVAQYYYKSCRDSDERKRISKVYLKKLQQSKFSESCSLYQSECRDSNVEIKCG